MTCKGFILFVLLISPVTSWGLATAMEVGVRGGVDDAKLEEHYSAIEIYLLKDLPWQKELSSSSRLYTRLDVGAAYVEGVSGTGGWAAAGGDIVLSLSEGVFELELGLRPALIFEDKFGPDDFGGPLQFSSHAGATMVLDKVALSYRYLHLSNAGIYDMNPGLDMHLIGMGGRF